MSTKELFEFSDVEPIVSMVTFRDYIVVATAYRLYKVTHDEDTDIKVEVQQVRFIEEET